MDVKAVNDVKDYAAIKKQIVKIKFGNNQEDVIAQVSMFSFVDVVNLLKMEIINNHDFIKNQNNGDGDVFLINEEIINKYIVYVKPEERSNLLKSYVWKICEIQQKTNLFKQMQKQLQNEIDKNNK